MLKSMLPYMLWIALGLLCLLSADPTWAQNVPGDLQVIGTAGGLGPDAEYATVRIAADGQGTYHRLLSSDLGAPALESSTFTLSTAEVEQLWQAIQDGDFFNLEAKHTAKDIGDRTYAELIVTANGSVHSVTTQNIALAGFDDIISTINALTPGDNDLKYDTSEPFTFTSLDICEQSGITGQRTALSKKGSKPTQEPEVEIPTLEETGLLNGDPHAGTVVAYRMALEEAVSLGIATLTGKGGGATFGDGVSITIDNSGSITNNRLTLTLYLELWGAGASVGNSLAIESAIESIWGGKMTTGGETLVVDVVTRTAIGASSAPGTSGFHQIEIVADTDTSFISGVFGKGTDFDVNWGVGSGTWSSKLPPEAYAHEAGHLMGLDDRYEDYRKQPDDTWIRESDGKPFTSSELTDEIASSFPQYTKPEILAKLEAPSKRRVTAPFPGSENDLMAILKGSVQQSDIDAFAALAGLTVEIQPGGILMNKAGAQQNYVITRSEDIFVPAGGNKTLGGLYVSCIDRHKTIPTAGVGYELAPSLSDWRGIEAALFLQKLLDYIDEQEQYCGTSNVPKWAVWRITDNSDVGAVLAEPFLLEAGIDLGDTILDFPRLTGANPLDPNTFLVTPPQLFIPDVESSPGSLVDPGTTVTLTGMVHAPASVEVSTTITWSLDTPAGSGATLSNDQNETTMFTADVRGIYRVVLNAEVIDTLANKFELEAFAPVAAVDAFTATFETGTLESEGPFYWKTNENPWIVTDGEFHTGAFSAVSADLDNGGISTIKTSFEQVADGPVSFAYRISTEHRSDSLLFSIDGEVKGRWFAEFGEIEWGSFSADLTAGSHTLVWTFKKHDSFGLGDRRAWIDDVFFPETAVFTSVGVGTDDGVPATYQLSQNYPNPFNPTTTITYAIPQAQHVRLVVYNALGRQVAKLVDGRRDPGQHQVQFDARGLSSGVYYYVLRAGAFIERKAMVLLK